MTTASDLAALNAALATAASAAATAEKQVAAGTPSEWASISAMFAIANAQKAAAALGLDINPPPPATLAVGTILPQNMTVSMPYSFVVKASGGTPPYTYLTHTMPPGITINATSGLISGTPTTADTAEQMIFTVMDAGSPAQEVTLTVNVVVVPAVTPPPPPPPSGSKPPLGFYGNGGSASNANATAKTLGVTAQGCSNYCDGTSWASIGGSTWTKSDANPLPAFVGVNLCPGAGNQKTGGLGQAAANASQFTNLAKVLNAKTDIARPGWEWDGNWFAWGIASGGLNAGNTTAKYIADFQACVTALRTGCPGLRIDWCGNSGSSTLAQLEAAYPGDAYVDIIGFDHYDAGSTAANLAAVTPTIQFAAQRGKPIGIGEWGAASNGTDNSAFIDFMAMLILNPTLFSATYNLPAYTVAYSSLFTDSDNNITNKPKMIAEFPKAFAGE